ncbi:MAG: ribonuclease HI family protein [Chloroflexota bacterium]|nr:ribonuclease HI family protein [Chloroflexota bacterium]
MISNEDTSVFAYTIVFDGGAIGNPGKGYGSFVVKNANGIFGRKRIEFGDRITNNQAEYRTLIDALHWLMKFAGDDAKDLTIRIRGDSALVINQLAGSWKARHRDLVPLFNEASSLIAQFGRVTLEWQPRAESFQVLGH